MKAINRVVPRALIIAAEGRQVRVSAPALDSGGAGEILAAASWPARAGEWASCVRVGEHWLCRPAVEVPPEADPQPAPQVDPELLACMSECGEGATATAAASLWGWDLAEKRLDVLEVLRRVMDLCNGRNPARDLRVLKLALAPDGQSFRSHACQMGISPRGLGRSIERMQRKLGLPKVPQQKSQEARAKLRKRYQAAP
jgi:hypothetical protein